VTGKIIHIDFGDCFEVACKRDKYPEQVPFRLTRMLTYAMEVSNIEGSFRITCEQVMRVLRDNKESVMAVLEAVSTISPPWLCAMLICTAIQFIHDPLLSWGLTNVASPTGPDFRNADRDREHTLEANPGAPRARRPSILAANQPPSEFLAGQIDGSVTGGPPGVRPRARTNSSAVNGTSEHIETEARNARAVEVLGRVSQKLNGRDFKPEEELEPVTQVNKLIIQATRLENLCQHYIGWCPFW